MSIILYDLPAAVRDLSDDCPRCHGEFVAVIGGEPCPDCKNSPLTVLDDHLRALQRHGEICDTALMLAKRIQEYETDAVILEQHAAAISARAARRRNAIAYIKSWMQLEMEAACIKKLNDAFGTIWLQDNPPSIEITDPLKVPEEFQRATVRMMLADVPEEMREFVSSTEPAKSDLKAYVENTSHVPEGVRYHPKGEKRHLRVRF